MFFAVSKGIDVDEKWDPSKIYLTYKRKPELVWGGDGEVFRSHLGGNYPREMFTGENR